MQETWKIDFKQFFYLDDYNMYLNSREFSQGGGVAIYVNKRFKSELIPEITIMKEFIFESIAVKIKFKDQIVIFANYYRSNSNLRMSANLQFDGFMDGLSTLLEFCSNYNSFIFSDSNIDLLSADNYLKDYMHLLLSYGYFHINFNATRFSSRTSFSLIDHIVTNVDQIDYKISQNIQSISDHNMLFVPLSFDFLDSNVSNSKCHVYRNFNQNAMEKFKNYLDCESWLAVFNESENSIQAVEIFENIFFENFNKCFPLQSRKIRDKEKIDFFDKKLKDMRKEKIRLESVAKFSCRQEDKRIYCEFRNAYNREVKKAKVRYYSNKFKNISGNPKLIWQNIRSETGLGKSIKQESIEKIVINNETVTNAIEIADNFNNFFASIGKKTVEKVNSTEKSFKDYLPPAACNSLMFIPTDPVEVLEIIETMSNKESQDSRGISCKLLRFVAVQIAAPLAHIYNLCIENGTFPSSWKFSKVIPIYKQCNSREDMNNYRPVGMIENLSKPFEMLIYKRTYSFLCTTNYFYSQQYGFLNGKNVSQALIKFLNYITQGLADKDNILCVLLDVAKAFNTIDHEILLHKLENAGIRGKILELFRSYLLDRTQSVQVNAVLSNEKLPIDLGVIQGSCLGPLIFDIYMNDLYRSTNLFCLLYADDTTVLARDKDLLSLSIRVNNEMEKVVDWFSSNRLSLNVSKTKVILFCQNKKLHDICPDIFIRDDNNEKRRIEKVKYTESVRLLGVYFDPGLTFTYFSDIICKRLASSLFVLRKLKNLVDHETLKLIYFAFFHSHLEFASFFLYGTRKNICKKVENLQKQAVRTLTNLPRISHTAEAFYVLEILPFNHLCEYNILKFMIQMRNGKMYNSFDGDWRTNNAVTGSQLRNANEYNIPFLKYQKLMNLPPFSFSKVYNNYDRILGIHDKSFEKIKDFFIDRAFSDNQCRLSNNCYVCNLLHKDKNRRIKSKKLKEMRIEKLIKQKGILRRERYDKALEKYLILH